MGFVHGLQTQAVLTNTDSVVCMPTGVTGGQGKLIAVKWLKDHPQELHLGASLLTLKALIAAFPCKK